MNPFNLRNLAAGLLTVALAVPAAHADAVDTLRAFTRDVQTGRATFTQTVTSPDGARKKSSAGSFEFSRPNRFRFAYNKPFEQLIVSDGAKVWLHDIDLNQVSVRLLDQALGGTPAALLAGGALDKDFELAAQPSKDGLDWVLATPRAKDGSVTQLRVGFRGKDLAALEITDAFGQRSQLLFSAVQQGLALPAERFRFVPPPGVDVIGR
ncbi:MAG: outer membrane lipoprotein chaperone LolA [Aquabacterium sp.]|nr:outer membrane lipoprotein chaperone LolA [Aquabacterium sp.]